MAAEKIAQFLQCAYIIDHKSSTLVSPSMKLFDLEDMDAPKSMPDFDGSVEITENSMERSSKVSASFSLEGSYCAFSGAAQASLDLHNASNEKTIRADHTLYAVKYKAHTNVLDYGKVFRPAVIKFVKEHSVEDIEKKLGHFYATSVTLGGTLHLTRIIKAASSDTASSLKAKINASYGTALSGSVKAQASAGSDHTSSTTGREETSRIRVQGGNISHWLAYDGSSESKLKCQKAWADDMTDDDLYPLEMKLFPIWEVLAEHPDLKEKAGRLEAYLLQKWKSSADEVAELVLLEASRKYSADKVAEHGLPWLRLQGTYNADTKVRGYADGIYRPDSDYNGKARYVHTTNSNQEILWIKIGDYAWHVTIDREQTESSRGLWSNNGDKGEAPYQYPDTGKWHQPDRGRVTTLTPAEADEIRG